MNNYNPTREMLYRTSWQFETVWSNDIKEYNRCAYT